MEFGALSHCAFGNGGQTMIDNTKCECGHNNPVGTILCEYCGKPLDDEIKGNKQTIEREMRYEGKARRSQTASASWFDQVWNFFSSVKVAIILIVITLIAAGIGTIFPQERFIPSATPEAYYKEQYGIWGEWYYRLGFSDMYSSWWFFLLIAMIGVSLVVCSLDRVVPLYQALKNQKVKKSTEFISRQRISHQMTVQPEEKEEKLAELERQLAKKGYQVQREDDALLAEKGRVSRWGPYINHIGLIIFLLGVLFRYIPGWYLDEAIWVREGEIKKVPETEYYVKNERSIADFYDQKEIKSREMKGPVVKKYQTDAVLYVKDKATGKLKPIHKQSILVNHPLEYEDLLLYQSDFRPGDLDAISFNVVKKDGKRTLGTFTVDLYEMKPDQVFKVGDMEVQILEYYPDFALENGRPVTRSQEPNQPAFIFEVREKGQTRGEGEKMWVIAGQNLDNLTKENQYDVDLAGIQTVNSSGLMVRIDKSLPIIFVGGFITMIGLVMGFYWQHRRVWVGWNGQVLHIGAHTNKNWFSLQRELVTCLEQAGFHLQSVKE